MQSQSGRAFGCSRSRRYISIVLRSSEDRIRPYTSPHPAIDYILLMVFFPQAISLAWPQA